nr:hypothetical protein [Tanacetum cinerariifolium]
MLVLWNLYTRDCICSKGNVEDKILVLKPPKNYAWCTRCGYLVDGPNCQGCALLWQELEENLVTHFQDFQNTSEPSNASTNVVNAPQEPYIVKQDNGSFVDKIIFYLNRAPDSPHLYIISPNQFRCFHCKYVLRDGEACKRCTCAKCGSGLNNGLCYICGTNRHSLNGSLIISETSSQSPPHINHCCYKCGDSLDGIFCKRCTCKSYGKDAHIGYNCPPKVLVVSNPKPCNYQTIDELPQTLPSFHPTFHFEPESPFTLDSTPTYVDESPNVFSPPPQPLLNSTLAKITDQMTSITSLCEMACNFVQKKLEEKQLEEERAAKAQNWKLPVCYDDDDDEERSDSLDDNIISGLPPFSAITPNEPVLSTEEPDNSLSIGDEHLDTILAMESNEFIKSGVENLILIPSESEGIPEHVCDVPSHDNSPPLDVSKDQIEDFFKSVSLEVMEIVIPEVGGIDDDILLSIKDDILREKLLNVNLLIAKIEALNDNPTPSFDCKTKSPSTSLNSLLEETNTFDNSLPEFENFCFDVKEISSGSTTTHSDISLLEYEVFYDDHVEPNSRDFTKDVVEDISPTKEPQVYNTLPTHPTLQLNLKFQPFSEYLFTYVV